MSESSSSDDDISTEALVESLRRREVEAGLRDPDPEKDRDILERREQNDEG